MPFRHDRLAALRQAKSLSQPELAAQAGISQSIIAKSERGSNLPGAEVLDKLAQALECTTDYLLGRGPDYATPSAAAAHMSFDVFSAQQDLTDEQRERCRRVLQHADAPKTAYAWRSFAEMLELAWESAPSTRLKSKPTAVARRDRGGT